jgi:hypothetical protein
LFGGISTGECDPTWSFKWIFLGDDLNPMYYSMHFINLFFGVWVLLNCDNTKWKRIIAYDSLFICFYILYVYIVVNRYGVTENATGVVDIDWISGEYSNVATFFGIDLYANPEKIGLVRTLGWSFSLIAIALIIFIFIALQKWTKRYKSLNSPKIKCFTKRDKNVF